MRWFCVLGGKDYHSEIHQNVTLLCSPWGRAPASFQQALLAHGFAMGGVTWALWAYILYIM
jgi:hypothetical protein